jgi:hypothetical protein
MEQQRRQPTDAKETDATGDSIGRLTHDLNNYLAVMQTAVEILQDKRGQDADVDFAAETIANAITSALQLTRQLRTYIQKK